MASSSKEVEKGDGGMLASEMPPVLRERLGGQGTEGLLEVLERTREDSVTAAIDACGDRFERRLVESMSALRIELAGLRQEIAVQHADLLKWSFLCWLGQVAVIAGLFAVFLRLLPS